MNKDWMLNDFLCLLRFCYELASIHWVFNGIHFPENIAWREYFHSHEVNAMDLYTII